MQRTAGQFPPPPTEAQPAPHRSPIPDIRGRTNVPTPHSPQVPPSPAAPAPARAARIPQEEGDWWDTVVRRQLRLRSQAVPVSLDDLLIRALNHSAQIRVSSDLPLIHATAITEADAAFDWYAFMDARWDDRSEPVTNLLQTGGPTRFQDHNFSGASGLRKRSRTGGQLELAQRIGWQDTNSRFFVPAPQGTSRLTLNYTHPLLRGSGQVYNESLTILARIETGVASDEMSAQLQDHLLQVIAAYWNLYHQRAQYVQKLKSFERAMEVVRQLSQQSAGARSGQRISADAEVEFRQSELQRCRAEIRNAEARIRALVNDPGLGDFEHVELIPLNTPQPLGANPGMSESMALAVQNRPEINQTVKQIRAACVRLNMSKNEMLPYLNLVTEAYVMGLEDRGQSIESMSRQFDTGAPSYSIGLQFEIPLGNRAARARKLRRQLELRQLQNQYQTTLESLELEVQLAVRDVETTYGEVSTKRRTLDAMHAKRNLLEQRWRSVTESGAANLVLEDLLMTQRRLSEAESEYLQALVEYNVAGVRVQRATGMLLQQEQIVSSAARMDGLPLLIHDKPPHPPSVGAGVTWPPQSDLSPTPVREEPHSVPPAPSVNPLEPRPYDPPVAPLPARPSQPVNPESVNPRPANPAAQQPRPLPRPFEPTPQATPPAQQPVTPPAPAPTPGPNDPQPRAYGPNDLPRAERSPRPNDPGQSVLVPSESSRPAESNEPGTRGLIRPPAMTPSSPSAPATDNPSPPPRFPPPPDTSPRSPAEYRPRPSKAQP